MKPVPIVLAILALSCSAQDATRTPRLAATAPAHCHATGNPQLPDRACTPGVAETTDLEIICHHSTRERRDVPTSEKRAVFAAYGIPWEDHDQYEADHLVPLCAGGANDARNLWPQPLDQANVKDKLEEESKRKICAGEMTPAEAQAIFEHDWTKFR